jgi:hypothetical protein
VKQIAVCTVIFSNSAHLSSIFTQIYGAASDIINEGFGIRAYAIQRRALPLRYRLVYCNYNFDPFHTYKP